MKELSPQTLEAIAFIGTSLAPFFLEDPKTGKAEKMYRAFAVLDARAAGAEWPFVDNEEAASAIECMVAGLQEDSDDALMWEYRRLFVGPAKKAAPPWGSVYTDRDQVMFGRSTLELREWMRAHGVVKTLEPGMPEDHIGYQLGCMAWLAHNKPACIDEYLRLHFLPWASHFLSLMYQATENSFYQGLATLTRLSLEGIQKQRGLEVVEPRFYR